MLKAIELLGYVAAVAGILLCAVAGIARISGHYLVGGYESMTLFNAGVGLMVFAVLVKVELLARGP